MNKNTSIVKIMCFQEHAEGCYVALPAEQITSKIELQFFSGDCRKKKERKKVYLEEINWLATF